MVFKVSSLNQQHQYYLETCYKCKICDLLYKKSWAWDSAVCIFNESPGGSDGTHSRLTIIDAHQNLILLSCITTSGFLNAFALFKTEGYYLAQYESFGKILLHMIPFSFWMMLLKRFLEYRISKTCCLGRGDSLTVSTAAKLSHSIKLEAQH